RPGPWWRCSWGSPFGGRLVRCTTSITAAGRKVDYPRGKGPADPPGSRAAPPAWSGRRAPARPACGGAPTAGGAPPEGAAAGRRRSRARRSGRLDLVEEGEGLGGVRAHEALQPGRRDPRPPAGPLPHPLL